MDCFVECVDLFKGFGYNGDIVFVEESGIEVIVGLDDVFDIIYGEFGSGFFLLNIVKVYCCGGDDEKVICVVEVDVVSVKRGFEGLGNVVLKVFDIDGLGSGV